MIVMAVVRAARHVAGRTLLAVGVWWVWDWTVRHVDLFRRATIP